MPTSLSLNGSWTLTQLGSGEETPAQVPGSVYGALLRAGKMEDPFWRDQEEQALLLMEDDFQFERVFEVSREFLQNPTILLRCEGLDTLAHIEVNGHPIGEADNMHRLWEFDVKPWLQAGENHIQIRLDSPTRFLRKAFAEHRAEGSEDAMEGFVHLRKAHCMFGWDWGPRLPDAGIWRDIGLVGFHARLSDVYVRQRHEEGRVVLSVNASVGGEGSTDLRTEVALQGPDGAVWTGQGQAAELMVEHPALWWPNGLGEQPLYTLTVRLMGAQGELDRWQRRIGLRTLEVAREPDTWGESFAHRVNGVSFFAMGADYIPEDNLLGRVTPQRTRRLLMDAKAAHFNVIRVWGGGYYPDDFFFDLCDELGLVVWQDFMFACGVYDLTPAFEANIRAELTDNIRRIRHHACLGLWCGNNEMEMFMDIGLWNPSPRQKADYIKMYEYIFPGLVAALDPDTFYWPASPSSGGSFDAPNDPDRGDVHYWAVWHGGLPFTDYRNHYFRYVSEFGFQAFPPKQTVESFTLPEDRNVFSYVMEKHQRNASANGKILGYLSQMYRYPTAFDTLLYASQLLQAQAIQYGVEHWRRSRGRCMGAVYWQLNDCWPVASWSSIDSFGRWKALHYFAKRFFAPVLLSCEEQGALSQRTNVNAEHGAIQQSMRLNVSNETRAELSGEVCWSLRTGVGEALREQRQAVIVPPQSALWLSQVDLGDMDIYRQYIHYALSVDGELCSEGTVLLCPPKHWQFPDPQLTLAVQGDLITVRAKAYARCVEICSEDGDALFSDNFFDMNPGEKQVRLLRGEARGLTLRSVYDI